MLDCTLWWGRIGRFGDTVFSPEEPAIGVIESEVNRDALEAIRQKVTWAKAVDGNSSGNDRIERRSIDGDPHQKEQADSLGDVDGHVSLPDDNWDGRFVVPPGR